MTDKVQKIREWVKARLDENNSKQSIPQFYGMMEEDARFLDFLDTMQEEPVSDELEKVVEEIVDPTVLNAYGVKEIANRLRRTMIEPVSENLGKAAKNYADNITDKIGYKLQLRRAVVYGAKWQKEQLMAKGVDDVVHHFEKEVASVHYNDPTGVPMAYYFTSTKGLSAGDKIKIIVIKED